MTAQRLSSDFSTTRMDNDFRVRRRVEMSVPVVDGQLKATDGDQWQSVRHDEPPTTAAFSMNYAIHFHRPLDGDIFCVDPYTSHVHRISVIDFEDHALNR